MRDEHFDIAVQIHGGGKYSNPFVLRLHAVLTVGLQSGQAIPLDRNVPYIFFQTETLRYLEVVAQIGAIGEQLEPHLTVTGCDLHESFQVVPEVDNLVAIHPGAGSPSRRWPPSRFAAEADARADEGASVVVTGTDSERVLTSRVVSAMKYPALNLAGRLSPSGLAGTLSRCSVVVSNDSGPLHLAQAVGSATVGIYWCINLVTAGPRSGPGIVRWSPGVSAVRNADVIKLLTAASTKHPMLPIFPSTG